MPDPAPVVVQPKAWYLSKTLWLNALSLGVVILTALLDVELVTKNPQLVLAFIAIVNVLNAVIRFLTNAPVTLAIMLALSLAFSNTAYADQALVKGIVKGQNYILSYGADGSLTLTVVPTVVVDMPTPGPGPGPNPLPPNPVLTARGTAIRDAATKAVGDTDRDVTAAKLAVLYHEIAKKARTAELDGRENMEFVLKKSADMVMPNAAAETAWKPMRDVLATQWTAIAQVPNMTDEDYAKLLDEAGTGLTASITKFQAIDFAALLKLILQILDIVLKLLPQNAVPLQ